MHTPGPWKLVWWGNEKYPFPLTILADNEQCWIARDGTVSSEANARLIAAAPETAAERDRLRAVNARLVEAMREAQAHLGAALIQSLPSDDKIIIGHMRDANTLLRMALAEGK